MIRYKYFGDDEKFKGCLASELSVQRNDQYTKVTGVAYILKKVEGVNDLFGFNVRQFEPVYVGRFFYFSWVGFLNDWKMERKPDKAGTDEVQVNYIDY